MVICDTIVAVSSPPGSGQRGIVRLSGDQAIQVGAALFRDEAGKSFEVQTGFQRRSGILLLDEGCTFPCESYVFKGPRSYTGQDLIELHTISSPPLLQIVVERAVRLGARLARPGEFSARAFLNGRLDMTRAEAVAALIRSTSDDQLRAAHAMMGGELAMNVGRWKGELTEITALLEAEIDFAEEPIDFISPEELHERLSDLSRRLDVLVRRDSDTARLEELPRILLLGPPNAGKSTLMNRLSGLDRSLCSPLAGTTRDLLGAPIRVGQREAILIDSAGIDALEEDEFVAGMRQRTLDRARHVNVICLVLDLTGDAVVRAGADEWMQTSTDVPRLVAVNKKDKLSAGQQESAKIELSRFDLGPVYLVSALSGDGIDELKSGMASVLDSVGSHQESTATILTIRQNDSLRQARHSINEAILEANQCRRTLDRAEVLAFWLREALQALAELSGEVASDDLLTLVFSRFCIGK